MKSFKSFEAKLNENLNNKKFHTNLGVKLSNKTQEYISSRHSGALERLDVVNKINQMIMEKPDLPTWTNEDVLKWLEICKLSKFLTVFKDLQIDGYELINIKEEDL